MAKRMVSMAILACAVTHLATPLLARAEEVFDTIVAVVARDVILQSEVDEFAQLQMLQTGQQIESLSPAEREQLRCRVLQGMIDDRLLVAKARADSVEVTPQQVEEALKEQLENIKRQFPSDEAYREQLRKEGTNERDLRNRLRVQMERYLLREKVMQQMGQKITVTFNEIERFYAEHEDSMPMVPASVVIAHITRVARPGDSTLAVARERLAQAQQRIAAGEDFGEVAKSLSQDPGTAPFGGDVGFFGRGQMVPEFEVAAFALDSGQISAPVTTQYGLHLIQNLGFRGDEVHARHILALAKPSPADYQVVRDTMMAIYRRLRAGADFGETARTYSMDPNVRQTGGRLGPISPDDLGPSFGRVLATLEIGQISEPFETDPGTYHIIKLLERTRAHKMNLADDRRQIEEFVRQQKLYAQLQSVLDRERERVYVDMRMPDCASVRGEVMR